MPFTHRSLHSLACMKIGSSILPLQKKLQFTRALAKSFNPYEILHPTRELISWVEWPRMLLEDQFDVLHRTRAMFMKLTMNVRTQCEYSQGPNMRLPFQRRTGVTTTRVCFQSKRNSTSCLYSICSLKLTCELSSAIRMVFWIAGNVVNTPAHVWATSLLIHYSYKLDGRVQMIPGIRAGSRNSHPVVFSGLKS